MTFTLRADIATWIDEFENFGGLCYHNFQLDLSQFSSAPYFA